MAKIHTINIGGKDRTLKYSFKSARELSRHSALLHGKPVDWPVTINNDSIDGMTIIVCYGLKHENPDLVPDTVLEWFDDARAASVEVFKDLVVPAKRALGESGSLGVYFTYDSDGRFTRDLAGKGDAAGA